MNYYEHHLGDYLRATAHLSMLEDGAYRRLLDAYYIKERPIPLALKDACRLVRAVSKPEREAVQTVLREFFQAESDGWRHRRCDIEIVRYNDKREKAQRSALARWGARPAENTDPPSPSSASAANEMRAHSDGNAPHTPIPNRQDPNSVEDTLRAKPVSCVHAVSVCKALEDAGLKQCDPAHPRLIALLERGATIANFVAAAAVAKNKNNPFAYVLGTVEGQMTQAAQISPGLRGNSSWSQARADKRAQTTAGLTGQQLEGNEGEVRYPSPIDVDSRFVQ